MILFSSFFLLYFIFLCAVLRDDVKLSSERIVFVRFVMIDIACLSESVDDERKNGEKMTLNGLELVMLWLFLLL